ncbi:MAG: tetratricopeptide repeat protein [Alphaproteobacteria bacterium]
MADSKPHLRARPGRTPSGDKVPTLGATVPASPARAPSPANDPSIAGLLVRSSLASGRIDEAVALAERTVAAAPPAPDLVGALGAAYLAAGRFEAAAGAFHRAFRLAPDEADAQAALGAMLRDVGRPAEAIGLLKRALAMRPSWAEAHSDLGDALEAQGDMANAIGAYQHAVALKPELFPAHVRLGEAFARAGRLTEAVAAFQRAKAIRPDVAEAYVRLADALMAMGQLDAALGQFERALELDPDHPRARRQRGHIRLLTGDFARGWPDFAAPRDRAPPTDAPLLGDGPVAGKTVLLLGDDDLRDTLQFVRFVPRLADAGARVVVRAGPALRALLAGVRGATVVAERDPLPAVDAWARFGDLPGITWAEARPTDVPYLDIGPMPKSPRRAGGPLRVAIARIAHEAAGSLPLEAVVRLARLPGMAFTCLDAGMAPGERDVLVGARVACEEIADLAVGARRLAGFDVIIAADNVLAHLAGALAYPVWLALPRTPDWRWLLGREDSPWYPTMRLVRQANAGDWSDVTARLEDLLAEAAFPDAARPEA